MAAFLPRPTFPLALDRNTPMTCTPLFVPSLSTPEPISSTELPISIPLVMKKGTTESTSTYSVPLKSIVHHASCHEITRRTSSIEKAIAQNHSIASICSLSLNSGSVPRQSTTDDSNTRLMRMM